MEGRLTSRARRAALWAAIGLAAALVAGCPRSAAAGLFPAAYDREIREAWALYHPGDPWLWWKAQLYQESRLDPEARSPVGAEGLAQFMPGPARQYGLVDRRLAGPSILAGARMMRDLTRFWKAPRTPQSRRKLAQASYNAGAGNIMKAQARCGGPAEYEAIMACLPMITGPQNARETSGYAPSIEKWFRRMQ